MRTTTNPMAELDEVERCRQVRRTLEQKYRDLDGLCDWLLQIARQPRRKLSQKKRPPGRGFKKPKTAISK